MDLDGLAGIVPGSHRGRFWNPGDRRAELCRVARPVVLLFAVTLNLAEDAPKRRNGNVADTTTLCRRDDST